MRTQYVVIAALIAAGTAASSQSREPEWPQYLGPSRNGNATMAIPASARLSVGWRKPLPSGSAGIVVGNGQAYTLGSDGEHDVLLAFDAASGNETWRVVLGPTHADSALGPGSTPVLVGDLVVAIATGCRMQAVNRQTRAVAWTFDFGAEFSSPLVKRGGCNMSPLVAGSKVIFTTGAPDKRLAAVDTSTGRVMWTAAVLPSYGGSAGWLSDDGGTILYHHVKQQPEASGITAIDPESGAIRWQIDGTGGASGTAPVQIEKGRVLIERWPHASLYDLTTRKAVWTTPDMTAQENPAVHHKGHLYGFGGQSGEFLTCLDASTGQLKWSSRIYRGHLALAGETLVVLANAAGVLRLVTPDPAGYRELTKVDVLRPGARTPTPPTVASGHIFVRNYEEIVAVKVGG